MRAMRLTQSVEQGRHRVEIALNAARIEQRLGALGRELFATAVRGQPRHHPPVGRDQPYLPDVRVEVATTINQLNCAGLS
jgi:hypothetical protein